MGKEAILITFCFSAAKERAYSPNATNCVVYFDDLYGCIISLESNPHAGSKTFFESLSLKKYPEFGKQHGSYLGISTFALIKDDKEQYKASLKSMLEKSIDVLSLLTEWQKEKLKNAGIYSIEDLHSETEENLIESIYGVGPVQARIMKNAATAELLEYLSG